VFAQPAYTIRGVEEVVTTATHGELLATPATVARTFATPEVTPFSTPPDETVAAVVFPLVQDANAVTSSVEPSE
jgi:hypothetical protein